MTLTVADVVRRILSQACEDYAGLIEVVWSLNSAYPDLPDDLKIKVSQQTVADLVARGLVEVYVSKWPPVDFSPLPTEQVQAVIDRVASWQATSDTSEPYYCIAATAAGEAEYLSGRAGSR